jgi:membrane-bound lytic murein transglycosylase B
MHMKARLPRSIALVLSALPLLAAAQPPFEECLDGLREVAVERGISERTADRVLPTVRELPRVVQADRDQPEFVETFATYLGRRVTADRITRGRELLGRHRALLERVAAEYGVPPQVLLAFWGLETNYGSVLGNVPVFDSLATLACEGRRGAYFTTEFVNALHIVESGIDARSMIGSWAGAMGQTQFMPSVYLEHAVDGDGDGVVDLWGSVEDAFASAGNFLRSLGWRPAWRWGREVRLPEGFDYARAGRDRPRPLEEWHALGVMTAEGRSIPSLGDSAALLVPAGHRGPAFLVYDNFDVIMRWNRSEFFALSVGHLADRIAGGGPLRVSPPDDTRLTREQIASLQRKLNELGFDSGEPDGIIGSATRGAVRDWQRQNGVIADGYVHPDLLRALDIPSQ